MTLSKITVCIVVLVFFGTAFAALAQVSDPAGCFSNGVCTGAEQALSCPDCTPGIVEEPEDDFRDAGEFPLGTEAPVTFPSASPSQTPVPEGDKGLGFTPFVFIGVFLLIGVVVAFFMFRSRNTSLPQ